MIEVLLYLKNYLPLDVCMYIVPMYVDHMRDQSSFSSSFGFMLLEQIKCLLLFCFWNYRTNV